MPLGIVLAAGWLDAMTLKQIADAIQQGSDILETELHDVPERQRSVRATFNYSWERLTQAERDGFMKLSVFRGGFTPAAAETVAGADIRALRKLANKSFIQIDASGRYTIQELLRQFGEQKLVEAGQKAALDQVHCAYFAEFMREREADVKGRRQLAAINEIEADFHNIRAAWVWAIGHGDADALDAMIEIMDLFCDMRTRYQDGEVLFGQAVREWKPQPGQERLWQRLRAR
jgi:predicted ATPase